MRRRLPGHSSACASEVAMVTATSSKEKTVKNRMVDLFSTQPLPIRHVPQVEIVYINSLKVECLESFHSRFLIDRLQREEVELHHFQHGVGRAFCPFAIRICHHVVKRFRYDLPRDA